MAKLNKAIYQSIEAPIGFVKKAYGQTYAYDTAGQRRSIKVGDEVFAFDTIKTLSGFIMVEFIDGSWMDMGANDQVTFNESLFGKEILTALTSTQPDDVSLIREALLAGKDPTDIAQPTAAGPGPEGTLEDLGSTPFILDRDNHPILFADESPPQLSPSGIQLETIQAQTLSAREVDESDRGVGEGILVGTGGTDEFIITNDIVEIRNFNPAEGDTLNFADLLVGEEDEVSLDSFLQLSISGDDTIINVSPDGSSNFTQQITLTDVNLLGVSDSSAIVADLLDAGDIIIT